MAHGSVTRPPDSTTHCPVRKLDRLLSKKQASSDSSSGRPNLPRGVAAIMPSVAAGERTFAISVSIKPGAMVLMRTWGANASLQLRAMAMTPALELE